MAALARPGPSAWRRRVSLLVAGAFVAFLAAQAPHLVHHFFEPEHVNDECPFAANGERTGGLETRPVTLAAIADVSIPWLGVAFLAPPSIAPDVSRGRAPPAPTS
ncbi:MAG: hypothetical protein DMD87_06890 [Candidatus Rokuibacteriota bacterium]|nr:MAG: hypothetical protein DMD87_06890 [Candidatus Rokubacteria bacterium]